MKEIDELNFTKPIYNFLKQNNINTLEDIRKINYELIIKTFTILQLQDYIHKLNNIICYLDLDTKEKINNKINEFLSDKEQPLEITIKNFEIENEILADSNAKKKNKILRLEFLKNERERLL